MQSIKRLILAVCSFYPLIVLGGLGDPVAQSRPTFNEEVDLLAKHFTPIVLKRGMQRVSVVPELQGRVMTSSAQGDNAQGFGWINYKYLSRPHTDNNGAIGGTDRLWLGPQAGPFSLFFEHGKKPVEIQVPDAISLIPFDVIDQSETAATFRKKLAVINHYGFKFEFETQRTVTLFSFSEIEAQLQVSIPSVVNFVGFSSDTKITNVSSQAWKKDTGLMAIWSMGAFYPSPSTTAVIPLKQALESATPYFDHPSPSHTRIQGNTLFYRADAQYMDKIGIPPEHSLPIIGSYDAERQLLTLITFEISKDPKAHYVNSVFDWQADPYAGEIINIYNDGPNNDLRPHGRFYEMETSSAALELGPNESQSHFHRTYHFQGDETALSHIAKQLLGVDIDTIKSAFAN